MLIRNIGRADLCGEIASTQTRIDASGENDLRVLANVFHPQVSAQCRFVITHERNHQNMLLGIRWRRVHCLSESATNEVAFLYNMSHGI